MSFSFRRLIVAAAAAVVTAAPCAMAHAQTPAPPPPPEKVEPAPPKPADVGPQPPQPAPEPPADPPPDDGPKPAGVGSETPPAPAEDETGEASAAPVPTRTFPGVPSSGTERTDRPYPGLFGGAAPLTDGPQVFNLSGSLYSAYSTDVAPYDSASPEAAGRSSLLAGGSGSAVYIRNWRAAYLGAHAAGGSSWAEAYQDLGTPWINRWNTGVDGGFTTEMGQRTRVSVSGAATYSPYLRLSLPTTGLGIIGNLPDSAAGLDNVVARDPNVTTRGTGSASFAVSRNSSIEAHYSAYRQNFISDEPTNSDRADQTAGIRYRYTFAKFVGLRAGYGYRHYTREGQDEPVDNHILDVGVDAGYGRSYALSRRTTFSFSTNTNIFVTGRDTTSNEGGFDARHRLFAGGHADLVHAMGRTWSSRIGYSRGFSYEVGFDEPWLTDSVVASLSGLVTDRLDFQAGAVGSWGSVGFSNGRSGDNRYTRANAVAGLRYAISRNLATYGQYFYYYHAFGNDVDVPGFLNRDINRQGVTVGITAWLPVFRTR
jgi:hypothetical protein